MTPETRCRPMPGLKAGPGSGDRVVRFTGEASHRRTATRPSRKKKTAIPPATKS